MLLEAKEVVSEICTELNVQMTDVLSKSRKRPIVEARAIILNELNKKFTDKTLSAIGLWFNRAPTSAHSFVIYNLKMFTEQMQVNKDFRAKYESVKCVTGWINQYNYIPQY